MKPKKLIWQQCGPGEIFAEVHTWIDYSICLSTPGGKLTLSTQVRETDIYIKAFDDIEAAKVGAQEDFNKFVQSLIE